MPNSDEEHPLRQLVAGILDEVNRLEEEYPDLWVLISFAANLSQALLVSVMHYRDLSSRDNLPLILWQQMTKYQFAALLQFVAREPDAGYTLMRNATELVRDVATLGSHPEFTERWHSARKLRRSDRVFRFDRSDPQQAYVHDLYKFASDWGTHGHITGLSGTKPAGLAGAEKQVQVRKVTDSARDEALSMWLVGFVPMQRICANVFADRASPDFRRFFNALVEQSDVFHKAAIRLRALAKAEGTA